MQRWLEDKIDIRNPEELFDFGEIIDDAELEYTYGTLKCEILDDESIFIYCPKLLERLQNITDQDSFDLHVDGTYFAIPKSIFPKKSRKKQFLTLMVEYGSKVGIIVQVFK